MAPTTLELSANPVWLDAKFDPGAVHRVAINLELDGSAKRNQAVALIRADEDDEAYRNMWGTLSRSPELGRFRYPTAPDGEGLCSFRITGPKSGNLRFGLRTWHNTGAIRTSPTVLVQRLGDPSGVYMSAAESAAFREKLRASRCYLEFGSGGSTSAAIDEGVARVVSVEADKKWLDTLRRAPDVAGAEASGRLIFVHADIGEVGPHSFPTSGKPERSWDDYWLAPWQHLGEPPDTVLVDARFRLACATVSLIACPATTLLLIHDYGTSDSRRAGYERILELADLVGTTGTLASFRRKPNFDPIAALRLLKEARNNVW